MYDFITSQTLHLSSFYQTSPLNKSWVMKSVLVSTVGDCFR